jgi:phasin family protein
MARKIAAPAAAPAIVQAPAPAAADQAAPAGSFDRTVAALRNSAAGAMAGYDNTQEKVNASMEQARKSAEEIVSFSQGNFEAMMKAGQIWAAGMQDLQKTFAATAQAQVEAAMGTMKALSGVKSLKEAMDLQASLARASLETAVSESGKLTDASMKLAEQTMAPITARVTLAVEKFARVG